MRRIFVFACCCVLYVLCAVSQAEIIDRVLAILPGQIVTLSDVEAALDFGLVEAPPGTERIAGGLSALVDRMLMLNEVRRVVPPELVAVQVNVRPAVSTCTTVVPQPEELTDDSSSETAQLTVTLLRYQPPLPSVPVIVGVTTGGVVSTTSHNV